MAAEKSFESDLLYQEALEASEECRHAEAIRLLEILVQRYADSADLYLLLGTEKLAIGANADARDHFARGLRLDPDVRAGYEGLAIAHERLGEMDLAEQVLRHALALEPHHYTCVLLGSILIKKKQYDEALDVLNKALDIDPSYEEAYLNIAVLFKDQQKYDEAVTALLRAIRLDPGYSEALYVLGMIYYAQEQYFMAEQSLRQALKLKPEHSWAMLYLALTLWQMKRLDEAESAFVSAMSLSSDPMIGEHYAMFRNERGLN